MSTPMKIATYALALVVVFIATMEIGYRLRPAMGVAASQPSSPAESPADNEQVEDAGHADDGGHATDEESHDAADPTGEPATHQPEGLAASVDGYQLTVLDPRPSAGPKTELRLRITGPDSEPVTAYEIAHGKELHLIVVRRDLASFQHVHPVLDRTTGIWTTAVDTSQAGAYRVFADMVPRGHDGMTLGADLEVAGEFSPVPVATGDVRTAEIDGYEARLTGDAHAGRTGTLTATIALDGQPVTDLDPYLEAYGHLVALRQADLAYLHVHPEGHPGDSSTPAGPGIEFAVDVPTPGTYRLFLDFSHRGVVRTAPFTLTVDA